MGNTPALSVGICTYNRADMLRDVLETFAQQTLDPSLFEILVIDNHSTDHTKDAVSAFAQAHPQLTVRYIYEAKQGVSHARNTAYLSAHSPYVVYIDDDELADAQLLEAYYNAVTQAPQYGVFAGKILIQQPKNRPAWFSEYIENWFGRYDFGSKPLEITLNDVAQKLIALPNCGNMAIQVALLKDVGGFDPELGRKQDQMLGGEETQVCTEALKRGYRMRYEPGAVIEHIILPERLTAEHMRERHFQAGKSYIRMRRARQELKPPVRYILGELSYLVRLSLGLLTPNTARRFETQLQITFEMGAIQEYFGGK